MLEGLVGFRVWGLGFGVEVLGSRLWGVGLVWGQSENYLGCSQEATLRNQNE